MVDCVILAGGTNKELDKPEEVHNKALIKVGGKEIVIFWRPIAGWRNRANCSGGAVR